MTAVALALAVAAVLWGVSRPADRDLEGRLSGAALVRWRPGHRSVVVLGVLSGVVLTVSGAFLLGGPPGAVGGLAGSVVGLTSVWLVRQRAGTRTALRVQTEVAHACGVLAAHLRVGQVATEALAVAATDCPILLESTRALQVGGDATTVWRRQARAPGAAGLLELARAWEVAVRTGAPLAGALDQVAHSLAAEQTVRSVVAGELAAPRASGKVMAALPACGIGMGYLLGGDPVGWLFGGPPGWACVLLGTLLACGGVMWIELLARRATVST